MAIRLASRGRWARGAAHGLRTWLGAEALGRKAHAAGTPRGANPFSPHTHLSLRNDGDLYRIGERAWFAGWDAAAGDEGA